MAEPPMERITVERGDELFALARRWGRFGDTDEREVRVLVRTERQPERMVSFEDMEIEGRLLPMDYRKIPFDAETQMSKRSNYYFSDRVYLLEPDTIAVDGEPLWRREPLED